MPNETPDKKPPRPVSAEWLFRAGAHYLERYSASVEGLRRVLLRKVRRRAEARGEAAADFEPLVEEAVARFVELKLVDDRLFAEAKLRSFRRRGTSARATEMKLREKGVDRETVAAVMEAEPIDERAGAHALARRRRLGPHRTRDRAERRDRDVAALMRAGFGYADAAAAIDAEPEEADVSLAE